MLHPLIFAIGEKVQDHVRHADTERKCCPGQRTTQCIFLGHRKADQHEANRKRQPDDAVAEILIFGWLRMSQPIDDFWSQLLAFVEGLRKVACISTRAL